MFRFFFDLLKTNVLGEFKMSYGCNVFQVFCKISTFGGAFAKWWTQHLSKGKNCETSLLQSTLCPEVGKSDEHSAPNRRARVQGWPSETPPCMLMAPGACKIRRGCIVLQVPIQVIPLGVPKRGSHPHRGRSKLWWHVSGPSLGMSPRPSATAHCIALVRC